MLLTTKAAQPYTDFAFAPGDTLMVGRESAGVPEAVHDAADARLLIPCGRACAPSMSPRPPPWCWAKPCARLALFPERQRDLHLTLFQPGGLVALAQVLMIDIMLAGDNAVVIGMAAARVPPHLRAQSDPVGPGRGGGAAGGAGADRGVAAAGHRPDPGGRHSAFVGELALLARHFRRGTKPHAPRWMPTHRCSRAIFQIVLADISMSLDNVLAVAGAARGHLDVLVIGLLLSVALMGAAAESDRAAAGALPLDQLSGSGDRGLCRAVDDLVGQPRSDRGADLKRVMDPWLSPRIRIRQPSQMLNAATWRSR